MGTPVSQTRLLIRAKIRLVDGINKWVTALIDTGAKVNLIQRVLVDQKYFKPSLKKGLFVTANKGVMRGGQEDVPCELIIGGQDVNTGERVNISCPMEIYDADIMVDMLISYEWLARMDVEVHGRRHGLIINRPGGPIWLPGIVYAPKEGQGVAPVSAVQADEGKRWCSQRK